MRLRAKIQPLAEAMSKNEIRVVVLYSVRSLKQSGFHCYPNSFSMGTFATESPFIYFEYPLRKDSWIQRLQYVLDRLE